MVSGQLHTKMHCLLINSLSSKLQRRFISVDVRREGIERLQEQLHIKTYCLLHSSLSSTFQSTLRCLSTTFDNPDTSYSISTSTHEDTTTVAEISKANEAILTAERAFAVLQNAVEADPKDEKQDSQ